MWFVVASDVFLFMEVGAGHRVALAERWLGMRDRDPCSTVPMQTTDLNKDKRGRNQEFEKEHD